MDRTVYAGAIATSLFLIAGSLWFSDNAAMWLASTSLVMNSARAVIIGLMLTLMFTNPPRAKILRLIFGTSAVIFLAWAIGRALDETVMVIDSLVFVQAGISFALATVEGKPLPVVKMEHIIATSSLFGGKLEPSSDMQALIVPRVRFSELFQQFIITMAVVSGALYKNLRLYRTLWRGG